MFLDSAAKNYPGILWDQKKYATFDILVNPMKTWQVKMLTKEESHSDQLLLMMKEGSKNVLKCKLAVPVNCVMKCCTSYCSVTHGNFSHLWLPWKWKPNAAYICVGKWYWEIHQTATALSSWPIIARKLRFVIFFHEWTLNAFSQ